jgi:hypothetical protein
MASVMLWVQRSPRSHDELRHEEQVHTGPGRSRTMEFQRDAAGEESRMF